MKTELVNIAKSFAAEYSSNAVYPAHLFKAVLHKDAGLVHFLEIDLDKDYYYLQEWADVQISLTPRATRPTLDYEWKDKKQQEKALTKDGKIAMRAEKVDLSVTDTEGKATGKVAVNAKVLEVKSMDVDKDKRTEKSLAKGSTMLLLSEKMYMGARDSKNRSAQVQVSSDKAGIFAENTLELQQAKAVVQLSGGNAAVGGGSLDLYGKTTLQSDVTAKGAIKGGDIEMKNMKVSSSFKSPSTSEGIAVPGAPATGKLSAKLKEEELK